MDIYRLLDLYKAAIDERRPFEGEVLTQLKEYYRIGLTWSSNALEGNTLTESETKVLLEDGLTVGGKPLRFTLKQSVTPKPMISCSHCLKIEPSRKEMF